MVVAAVYEKIFDHWTHKALNIIFPTFQIEQKSKYDDIGGVLIEWSVKIPRQGIFISWVY